MCGRWMMRVEADTLIFVGFGGVLAILEPAIVITAVKTTLSTVADPSGGGAQATHAKLKHTNQIGEDCGFCEQDCFVPLAPGSEAGWR